MLCISIVFSCVVNPITSPPKETASLPECFYGGDLFLEKCTIWKQNTLTRCMVFTCKDSVGRVLWDIPPILDLTVVFVMINGFSILF